MVTCDRRLLGHLSFSPPPLPPPGGGRGGGGDSCFKSKRCFKAFWFIFALLNWGAYHPSLRPAHPLGTPPSFTKRGGRGVLDETSKHAARGHPTGLLACSRDPTQSRCSERPPVRPGVSRRKGGKGGGITPPPSPPLPSEGPAGSTGVWGPLPEGIPTPKEPSIC